MVWPSVPRPAKPLYSPVLEPKKKDKSKAAFWRACRYLGPHRRIVAISVFCALIVGVVFTSGLGTMLPIMQVLINEDTVPDWVNRKVAEGRLEVRLADDLAQVRLARTPTQGPAARHQLRQGQILLLSEEAEAPAKRLLALLASPQQTRVEVEVIDPTARREAPRQVVPLELPPLEAHWALVQRVGGLVPTDPIRAIGAVLVFLIFLSIVGNVVRFVQEYLSEMAAILAVRDIRRHLYDHTLHLHLSFFGQKGTSDVASRLMQDAQGLQEGMKSLIGASIQEAIKAAMALGLALFVSWQLTLFIIVFAPAMFFVIKKFGKAVRRAARAALQNSSAMLGQIDSSLAGIRVVKSANAERFERRRFGGLVNSLIREQLRIARMEAFNTPMVEMLTLIVVCAIVLYASYLVLVLHSVDRSIFFLVMACLVGIGESLRKVSKINNLLQKSNAAAARLFEIIDLPVERPRQRAADGPARPRLVLPSIQRDIRFEALTFTYPGANQPALSGVNLSVQKGQSIAVVGRNGSGKTTLLALLPRFYDPQQGRILIDGVDIQSVTLSSLRRQIGIVTQDSVIFPGTIAQNIAYALPQARRPDIIAAAQQAFAHEFIMEKPAGYDTVLGAHGLQLSGGQKQRLCIARAILRQTPILILDEATSQVDAESEHLIQQAIATLMKERTTFVIAHRFSTILSADLIVVMDRGQIVAQGAHGDLLASCPTYQQLYERQIVAPAAEPARSTASVA